MNARLGMVIAVAVAALGGWARADVIHNEAAHGDLSGSGTAPTARTLTVGTHTISGSVGSGDTQDWINLRVPSGARLVSIILDSYSSSDARAFMGVQAGELFVGSDQSAPSYMGYTHFGPSLIGADLLARMGDPSVAMGAQGFDPPLEAGPFTFLIQQFGDETQYQFTVTVVAVPGPATAVLAVCGAAMLASRRRTPARR